MNRDNIVDLSSRLQHSALGRPVIDAWWRGHDAGKITGQGSQSVCNPFGGDEEPELYRAWEAGFDGRPFVSVLPPSAKP